MAEDGDKKKLDNRWWEFYFVRYFVGTAIGAVVVLFLAMSSSPVLSLQGEVAAILRSLKPEQFESGYVAVLATVGLAFCYIASSPILVLHATRGSLLKVRVSVNAWWIATLVVTVLALSGAQSYALWLALKVTGDPWSFDFYAGSAFLTLITLIFVGQVFLLWLSLFGKEETAFDYYDELVKRRAAAQGSGQEYIETYRHLREHGNAFFIVLLELLLGAALFYSPVPWAFLVMLWIFPAAGVWFFGTRLESRNF